MFLIKTKFGNFGSLKDLLHFMKDEKIKSVQSESFYVMDKVNTLTLTCEDIENILKDEVL